MRPLPKARVQSLLRNEQPTGYAVQHPPPPHQKKRLPGRICVLQEAFPDGHPTARDVPAQPTSLAHI